MNYFSRLRRAKGGVVVELQKRGVESKYLKFGGPGDEPLKSPTVPTDSRSEFLANRAMGDWAEKVFAAAIRTAIPEWQATHYGNTEAMAAGDEGFKTFYLAVTEEVRKYGKRPDLLIFPRGCNVADDISAEPFAKVDPSVKHAVGAFEVRSSKFEALKYIAVRLKDREAGKSCARDVPSFTVKVEDLKIVYRWIERNLKPQAYAQVFFDCVYAINVRAIFEIIGSGAGFAIETPAKSQQKSTIFIPITAGKRVGSFNSLPRFTVAERVTRLGRHDAYVVPVGGELQLDGGLLTNVLLK